MRELTTWRHGFAMPVALVALASALGVSTEGATAQAATWARAKDAKHIRLVGHRDLNGNGDGGEGLALRQYPDGRRVLFIAHLNAPRAPGVRLVTAESHW